MANTPSPAVPERRADPNTGSVSFSDLRAMSSKYDAYYFLEGKKGRQIRLLTNRLKVKKSEAGKLEEHKQEGNMSEEEKDELEAKLSLLRNQKKDMRKTLKQLRKEYKLLKKDRKRAQEEVEPWFLEFSAKHNKFRKISVGTVDQFMALKKLNEWANFTPIWDISRDTYRIARTLQRQFQLPKCISEKKGCMTASPKVVAQEAAEATDAMAAALQSKAGSEAGSASPSVSSAAAPARQV